MESSRDLLIEFDSRQVRLITDIPAVYERASSIFEHMIVDRMVVNSGSIEVMQQGEGFTVRGTRTLELGASELGYLLDLVKDEIRTHFVNSRPDLLWLHAGAIERDGRALLIAGESGQGKSTVTTRLSEHGWRYMSDDVAPVRMDTDSVLPFPQTPVRRVYPGRPLSPSMVQSLVRETITLDSERVCRTAVEIRGIIYIEFAEGEPASLARLTQGDAALDFLRNATNFLDHRSAAVEKAAVVARRLPAFRLAYSSHDEAVRLLRSL